MCRHQMQHNPKQCKTTQKRCETMRLYGIFQAPPLFWVLEYGNPIANILFSNISKVPHKIQSEYLRSYTSFLHSVLDSMYILLSYLYEINTSKIPHMRYFIKVIKNMFLGFYKQFFAILFFVCETKFQFRIPISNGSVLL